jgi:hypothetical protein
MTCGTFTQKKVPNEVSVHKDYSETDRGMGERIEKYHTPEPFSSAIEAFSQDILPKDEFVFIA